MNFAAVREAVKQADLFRYQGKIEKIIGMTIEASGPEANIGDVCRPRPCGKCGIHLQC